MASLGPVGLVLDTDIGTDVDDVLALVMLLGSPEVTVEGVTTVYGDVLLRARMAARFARIAGRPIRAVVPGCGRTRSGRPVWWPGHEGQLLDKLDSEPVATDGDPAALLASADQVLAIGPLTNLAAAVDLPGDGPAELVVMGGEFIKGTPEHNIRCDVAAADVVFSSGRQATVVGLDQTERVRFEPAVADWIASMGELGRAIAAEMRQFWRFTAESSNVPHDAVAALTLVRPDLFTFRTGEITVVTSGDHEGRTHFRPDPGGPHRIVTDLDESEVADQILRRVLAACEAASPAIPAPRTVHSEGMM